MHITLFLSIEFYKHQKIDLIHRNEMVFSPDQSALISYKRIIMQTKLLFITIQIKPHIWIQAVIMLSRLTFAGGANKLVNAKHDVKQYDS